MWNIFCVNKRKKSIQALMIERKVSLNSTESSNAPSGLCDPITLELFRDPVTAEDGRIYERESITKWLRQQPTSPFTRQPMDINNLQPNDAIRERVERHRRLSVSYKVAANEDGNVRLPSASRSHIAAAAPALVPGPTLAPATDGLGPELVDFVIAPQIGARNVNQLPPAYHANSLEVFADSCNDCLRIMGANCRNCLQTLSDSCTVCCTMVETCCSTGLKILRGCCHPIKCCCKMPIGCCLFCTAVMITFIILTVYYSVTFWSKFSFSSSPSSSSSWTFGMFVRYH